MVGGARRCVRDDWSVVPGLQCYECPAVTARFERGWRAYLTDDEFEPEEVAILCPECAEREFGPLRTRRLEQDDA
jgi:hypothetical protein